MPKAIWNKTVLAHSDQTEVVEGNHYFPPASLNREHFRDSEHQTYCGWKGTAIYYDLVAGGETKPQAAWYYPDPKPEAAKLKDCVAFWNGVEVTD